MRARSCGTIAPAPRFRWPTSELPIWPSGRPTASPFAVSCVCGCSAHSRSNTGVSASEIALPGPSGARPQPSRITRATAGTIIRARPRSILANEAGSRLRTADERAVDVRQRQQLGRVVGLQRAAVEDPHGLAGLLVAVLDERAHERDRVLRLLGRGDEPGADRPDRLVGDDDLGEPLDGDLLEPLLHLVAELALGVPALALLLGLAHAEDRREIGFERAHDLLLQRLVGLGVQLAALGVSEHDAVDVDLARISADTSPVNAPVSASCIVCAKTWTSEPRAESTIACSARNGAAIAMSTPSKVATFGSSAWMNASASAIVLFIFQLPAMNGVRSLMKGPPRRAAACPRRARATRRRPLTGA